MILPTDPVPPLPRLQPRDRVRVVDAKSRAMLDAFDGRLGRIYSVTRAGQPLRFVPDGDHRTYPVETARHRGNPDALIVEPIS